MHEDGGIGRSRRLRHLAGILLEKLDGVADRDDGLSGVIRDLDVELFLERHHELDGVEAVGAEVIDEVGIVRHLVGFYTKVLDNDLLHALSDVTHRWFLVSLVANARSGSRGFRLKGPGRGSS